MTDAELDAVVYASPREMAQEIVARGRRIAELEAERDAARRLAHKAMATVADLAQRAGGLDVAVEMFEAMRDERDALREALTEVRHQFLDGAQVGWSKRMLDRVDAALGGAP